MKKESLSEKMGDSQWTTVTRRKPFPAKWRHAPEPLPTTKPFSPYQASFAQVVRRSPTNDTLARTIPKPHLPKQIPNILTPANLPPHNTPLTNLAPLLPLSNTTSTNPSLARNQYTTTHTSPGLRFPPSPTFPEWRGRCFRCCQKGHTVASCKNLTKCGRCWGDGHIGLRCTRSSKPQPKPRSPAPQLNTLQEPSFDELLQGSYPYTPRLLPQGRVAKTYCYIARDEGHIKEMERLRRGVVLYAPDIEVDLTIEEVAEYAAMTGLTSVHEVSIGILTKSRYLIHLPPNVEPLQFIKAIPMSVWDKGYSFWQWSPAMDSVPCNPKFKALLDLDGVPMHLSNENDIAKAVGGFGVYLGTLEQSTLGDVACWTVAVAVTELENIPVQIEYVVGGWETPIDVRCKTWVPTLLLREEQIPKQPVIFTKPPLPLVEGDPSSGDDISEQNGEDSIPLAKSVVIELCRGRDIESLPMEVREILAGEAPGTMQAETKMSNIEATPKVTAEDPNLHIPLGADLPIVSAVADPTPAEIITTTPTEGDMAPQQIIPIPGVETEYSARGTEAPVLANKIVQEPSQNLLRRTGGDKRGLKLKQVVRDTCPAKSIEGSNGCHLKKGGVRKTPGGHITLQHVTFQKRKPVITSRGESSRRPQPKINGPKNRKPRQKKISSTTEPEGAQLEFDPKGYIEVHVDAQHCENIARACGIPQEQIESLLLEDNLERVVQQEQREREEREREEMEMESEQEQEEHLSDFEPQTEDDLSSGSD